MKFIAVIPARWASSRFPGKPLAVLDDKPIIQHVYHNAVNSGLFDKVIVATDSQNILDTVHRFGGLAKLTDKKHRSGTDRIVEVCSMLDFDIVVNIQGDEPFLKKQTLSDLISVLNDPDIQVASLMHPIANNIDDPNQVKVVCNNEKFALYFSRSPIPANRENDPNVQYFGHIGVYAFRKIALLKFVSLAQSPLEKAEKLEQLRLIENGIPIKMINTDYSGFGIDTPQDLIKAQILFNK